jgi:formylglycine-generating enzyme required for sulfatase activity/ribosomal protein L32
MGTLYYESPEQIKGAKDVDQRSDIYSLGMTLYEMLAGRLPFDDAGDTSEFQIMNSIVNRETHLDPRKYYPHIPEWLVEVVQKATNLNPEKRFQNCEVFKRVLEKHGNLSASESGYWSVRVASAAQAPLAVSKPISTGSSSPVASEDRCPKCSSSIEKEMEFCGKCGGDLQKNCPACGKKIRWHHEFCPKCGENIGEKLASIEAETERRKQEEVQKQQAARITEQKRQDEAQRLAAEVETERRRLEEERRQQEEKKLKEKEEKLLRKRVWRKKHGWKVAASIVVVAAGLAAVSYLKSDAYAYLQAEKLYNSEDYPRAVTAFEELGDYRDSQDRSLAIRYEIAEELYGSGAFEEAVAAFTELGEYQDSHSRVLGHYQDEAEFYAEQGSLDSAAVIIQTWLMDEDSISADLELIIQSYPGIGAYLLPANMAFACIPSGSFSMGSPSSESERGSDEGPVHTVNIQSFELMTTEVTQGMWEELMGTNPSNFTGDLNRPVESVSWNDCQEFINRMNDLDPSYTYRLPSEAEWEYACRAGTTTRYYWEEDPASTEIGEYAWYDGNSSSTTHPVAQKLPNAWGLYDMSGNVWEWCADWYHESFSGAPTDGSPWVSPSGSYRVARGGGWYGDTGYYRSSHRGISCPGIGGFSRGFRLARSVR